MLKKIPIYLKSNDHPGITELDNTLQESMKSTPGKSLQELADILLEKGRQLHDQKKLTFEKLKISLHKVKSKDWNVLLVRYRKNTYYMHIEVVQIPEQTALIL